MLMLFLWRQSHCVASDFILLKENEIIEAETECAAFPSHRQYWKIKHFCVFRKCEIGIVFCLSGLLCVDSVCRWMESWCLGGLAQADRGFLR